MEEKRGTRSRRERETVMCSQQRRLGDDGTWVVSGMDFNGGSPQRDMPETIHSQWDTYITPWPSTCIHIWVPQEKHFNEAGFALIMWDVPWYFLFYSILCHIISFLLLLSPPSPPPPPLLFSFYFSSFFFLTDSLSSFHSQLMSCDCTF